MNYSKISKSVLAAAIAMLTSSVFAADNLQIPAFPGAEGYGAGTVGGRGDKVYIVSNLNDDGPGSLREAIEAKGPRTVVFGVSGKIELTRGLNIRNPNITIAGQTAPGDGICLANYPLEINADDVVVRYLRIRLGGSSGKDTDAVSSRYRKNIILDHLSSSWSIDETFSVYHCENVTVQWCVISESLYASHHVKGSHGFGGIWGSNYSSYHHNLLAHHSSRNPRFASGCGYTDFRNNVIYNWGYDSTYGGEQQQVNNPKFNFTMINSVANYYKPGPGTGPGAIQYRVANPWTRNLDADFGKWYVADNYVEGHPEVTRDNWNGGVQIKEDPKYLTGLKLDKPWEAMPIKQQTPEEAYKLVLDQAGAVLPGRDSVDLRVINETRTGTATYEGKKYKIEQKVVDASKPSGMIDSESDVGGWPEYKTAPAPTDTDTDGMPDDWETQFDLDPRNPEDNSHDTDKDGYTNLEEYLNQTNPNQYVDYTKPENNTNTMNHY